MLATVMRPLLARIETGELHPLRSQTFHVKDVAQAFRRLASGRSIGKLIVTQHHKTVRESGAKGIRADAQYLVTGGLGALGLHVAEWLVRNGASRIVLLGRNPPGDAVREDLERLRACGVTFEAVACNVADRTQLAGVISNLQDLAGVFHCAGTLDDGIINNQTLARFERVLSPKIDGVINLHDLTLDRSLDHFVCFSSTSALLDGAGQSNYAAANAYLDAFIQLRRTLGLPGISINWGGWAGGGMAARLASRKPALARDLLQKEEGIAALAALIERDIGQAVVCRMRARLARDQHRRPLFRELTQGPHEHPPPRSTSFTEILQACPGEIMPAVVRFLKIEVAKILGLEPATIGEDDDFLDSGIDSLMLAELRNSIRKGLGKQVSATAVFANRSIRRLAAHLLEENEVHVHGSREGAGATSSALVMLSRGRGGPLFCIPGVGNNVFDFQHVSEGGLDASICVFNVHEVSANGCDELTFLTDTYIRSMQEVQPEGPYHLVGYSWGGTVAVELAHRLLESGSTVGSLTLLDSIPAFSYRKAPLFERVEYSLLFDSVFESIGLHPSKKDDFYAHLKEERPGEVLGRFRMLLEREAGERMQPDAIDRLLATFVRRLHITYQPPRRLGMLTVTQVKATRTLEAMSLWPGAALDAGLKRLEGAYGWEAILENDIEVVSVDCTHLGLIRRPAVRTVIEVLARSTRTSLLEASV